MTISLEIRGIAAVRSKLAGPDLVAKPVAGMIAAAVAFGEEDARNGARDLGAVVRTIAGEATPLAGRIVVRHPGARAIEYGRHAGRRMPPVEALRGWAQAHGLAGSEFVVAKAIARRGIKGRFFLRRTRDRLARQELPRLIHEAARAIEQRWGHR